MGAQSVWTGTAERALSYAWSPSRVSNKEAGIDGVAIAPYFGDYLGTPANSTEVENWTRDWDGGLNKLFDELTQGGNSFDWTGSH
jgi:hypothetical protein